MNSVAMIESVAASLGEELRERFVFVGGAVLELLITDPTVIDFRPTTDVDLVVEAATYGTYAAVEQTLADHGFTHVVGPGVPICRWRIGEILADVMPTEESILGFGNRWYPEVLRTAVRYSLPSGAVIRLTAPQYFIATKLEAFQTRGTSDARVSYDMEDIIAVLDGRSGIADEITASESAVRSVIAGAFQHLNTDPDFQDAIQGYLSISPDAATRRAAVLARIAAITQEHP
jgi:predicted nucleotidyltransferase